MYQYFIKAIILKLFLSYFLNDNTLEFKKTCKAKCIKFHINALISATCGEIATLLTYIKCR